jgi:aerobic C4-dicarboxylate transport protein
MAKTSTTAHDSATKKPWYRVLYIQVLIAIVLGGLIGWLFTDLGKN